MQAVSVVNPGGLPAPRLATLAIDAGVLSARPAACPGQLCSVRRRLECQLNRMNLLGYRHRSGRV